MAAKSLPRQRKLQKRKKQTLLRLGGAAALLLGVLALWFALRPLGSPSVAPLGVEGSQVGETAPDFSLPTLDGGLFTLSEGHGRPTILFFMAYWCGTCIPEARALARLQREYGDALTIIAIDVDPSSTPEALAQFKRAADDGDFTWAFDAGQQVAQAYQVRSLDTTLILDENGVVLYRDEFPSPYSTLKRVLSEAGY